jgi:hypothetical protein
MSTIKIFFSAIKTTLTSLPALAVFTLIYALLLAAFFRFIWIREATLWQVFITYTLMVLIPALFFIYQAAIIGRARDLKFRWGTILVDAVKFFVATIPILLIAWLLSYLLNKWQLRFPAPALPTLPVGTAPPTPRPLHWAHSNFRHPALCPVGSCIAAHNHSPMDCDGRRRGPNVIRRRHVLQTNR